MTASGLVWRGQPSDRGRLKKERDRER